MAARTVSWLQRSIAELRLRDRAGSGTPPAQVARDDKGVRPTRPERGGGGQRVCPFHVEGPCPAARPGCGERQEGNGRREVARLLERRKL
jgi:hypothetical protein